MSDNVIVTTKPERLLLPAEWGGAVKRDGADPVPMDARDWQPGDVVQCMLRVGGKLQPVSFVVGSVEPDA